MLLNVIALPKRRQQAEAEINRLGIEARYWDAIIRPLTIEGISLSHRRIVKWAKENNLSEVAIAEDDCVFTSLRSWTYFLEQKPEDFDIYLGGYYDGIPMPDKTLYSFSGIHLYIIASRYYDTFLSTTSLRNIDKAQAGRGRFVYCEPLVAKQRNGYSYHRKKVVNDDSYLEGKKFLTD